jgi:histidine ammonia-lyase
MSYYTIDRQLSLTDIAQIINEQKKLTLSEDAVKRIEACRNYLDKKMLDDQHVFYGINTGFGSLCNTRVSKNELEQLQYNLLRSHACGTGNAVPQEIIKLMLLLKIQSLAYGHSGVQLATVNRLIDFYNNDILPVVYEQGSLGASGDLAPLAHLCLPLIGEGKVYVKQNDTWMVQQTSSLIQSYEPIKLKSKEGLALINGTQFMLAYGVWCLLNAQKLSDVADKVAAISIDAFDCKTEPFHPLIHLIRPHKGQQQTAANILELLKGSEIAAQQKVHVQDPYAFRCIPQVHGAGKDALHYVQYTIENELNSVTDNPNIFPDEDLILSGGNFHGQPLALALDFLAIAIAELGSISERRTYQLISGQRGLPPFLTQHAGSHSGMMIPQYTAASIVSRNKQLCTPASVDSIVSSNGQEDHVSMGANAAVKCKQVVDNVYTILSIELMNAAQAMEFRRPLKSGTAVEELYNQYRKHVSKLDGDRILHEDILLSEQFIRNHV